MGDSDGGGQHSLGTLTMVNNNGCGLYLWKTTIIEVFDDIAQGQLWPLLVENNAR